MTLKKFSYYKGLLAELFVISILLNEKHIPINWRYKNSCGEIDLIAVNFLLNEVTFVEIKFRQLIANFDMCEIISKKQQIRIINSAEIFLTEVYPKYRNFDITFDVCFVDKNFNYNYIRNAFGQ